MIDVQWMTCFLDRPADGFERTVAFWQAVTGSSLSAARGESGQFATLLPADGDAFVRVQRVDAGEGGSHLDLHVRDVGAAAATAVNLGASVVLDANTLVVLRSPGGFGFCLSAPFGDGLRPRPTVLPGATSRSSLDQLALDIPGSLYESECQFWQALTGWELVHSSRGEFRALQRADGMPLRLLLHRLGPDSTATGVSAHPDLACESVDDAVAAHLALGATLLATHPLWTAMLDPSGRPYCLTSRNPYTGLLERQ